MPLSWSAARRCVCAANLLAATLLSTVCTTTLPALAAAKDKDKPKHEAATSTPTPTPWTT